MFLKAALFMHNIMQIRSQNLFDFGAFRPTDINFKTSAESNLVS